jgi:hypothetical protein
MAALPRSSQHSPFYRDVRPIPLVHSYSTYAVRQHNLISPGKAHVGSHTSCEGVLYYISGSAGNHSCQGIDEGCLGGTHVFAFSWYCTRRLAWCKSIFGIMNVFGLTCVIQLNIYVNELEQACLDGFASSVLTNEKETPRAMNEWHGDVRWTAPELLTYNPAGANEGRPTTASDIYAYGMVVWEIGPITAISTIGPAYSASSDVYIKHTIRNVSERSWCGGSNLQR